MERTSPGSDIAALRHVASTAIMLLVELITRDPEPLLPALLRESAVVLDDMAARAAVQVDTRWR